MSQYKKKNILIGGLLAVVLVMAVSYAAFASNLNITGTASSTSNWCVGFDSTLTNNVSTTTGVTNATAPQGSISYTGVGCSSTNPGVTLTTTLNQPGDKVEYTLKLANKGSLNAAIESIKVGDEVLTSNTTKKVGNILYKIDMPDTTSLVATTGEATMKVTIEFQNETDISTYNGETSSINISINAIILNFYRLCF